MNIIFDFISFLHMDTVRRIVFGGLGSGKSFQYVTPNICQASADASLVIVDAEEKYLQDSK